jgi:hypothetical protein
MESPQQLGLTISHGLLQLVKSVLELRAELRYIAFVAGS